MSSPDPVPRFSVVIPLYNKRNEIRRTIASVLAQTFGNFELIVVNDGSTDGGEGVVAAITDSRVRLIHQENAGQGAARNAGIACARSEFVAFLDADDSWKLDHLQTIEDLVHQFPGAGAYCTAFAYHHSGTRNIEPIRFKSLPPAPWQGLLSNYLYVLVEEISPVTTNSICVRRSVLQELGAFNTELPLAQDVDLWIRIFLSSSIVYTSKATTFYHMDTENRVTRSADRPRRYLTFAQNLSRYIADATVASDSRVLLATLQCRFGRRMAREAFLRGDYSSVREALGMPSLRYTRFERTVMDAVMALLPPSVLKMVHSLAAAARPLVRRWRHGEKQPAQNVRTR